MSLLLSTSSLPSYEPFASVNASGVSVCNGTNAQNLIWTKPKIRIRAQNISHCCVDARRQLGEFHFWLNNGCPQPCTICCICGQFESVCARFYANICHSLRLFSVRFRYVPGYEQSLHAFMKSNRHHIHVHNRQNNGHVFGTVAAART